MKNALITCCLLTLLACSEKKTTTQETVDGQTQVKPNAGTEPPVAPSSDKPSVANANAGTWLYRKTIDNAGHPVYKASTISPTLLEFGFPYAGGSTATLTIRKRENDTHVYIQISKGQFNRSFQGGKAHVRFDTNPPVLHSFSAAENGSANVIFFDSERALIDQIKKAKKMIVDVEFSGHQKRQIAFTITGLRWNH